MKVTYERRYWDQFDITKKDTLYVFCSEVWDDRLDNPAEQERYGFGLTNLGGMTAALPENKIKQVAKFNYQIEKADEVGLCQPFSLIITPRNFYKQVFMNNYDSKMNKYLSDIIEANEKYAQTKEIYFTFYPVWNIDGQYFKSEEMKEKSLKNLESKLKSCRCKVTQNIVIDAEIIPNY